MNGVIDELDIEVPMKIRVRFHVHPAEKMTRHYPGCPAHVDDMEFSLWVKEWKDGKLVDKEVPVLCGWMHDQILKAMSDEEWQDLCFEEMEGR